MSGSAPQPLNTLNLEEPVANGIGTPFIGTRVAPAVRRNTAVPSWSWGSLLLAAIGSWCLFVAIGYGLYRLLFG